MLIPIVVAILVTLAVVAPITWFISGKAMVYRYCISQEHSRDQDRKSRVTGKRDY